MFTINGDGSCTTSNASNPYQLFHLWFGGGIILSTISGYVRNTNTHMHVLKHQCFNAFYCFAILWKVTIWLENAIRIFARFFVTNCRIILYLLQCDTSHRVYDWILLVINFIYRRCYDWISVAKCLWTIIKSKWKGSEEEFLQYHSALFGCKTVRNA